MLLADRNVIVYGVAADAVSRAVAVTLAAEGARCSLVGTDPVALDSAAGLARARGGSVETAVLDPADAAAVEDHLGALLRLTGSLDGSVHVTPVAAAVSAAARHMARQACGVIVLLGTSEAARPGEFAPGIRVLTLAPDALDRIAALIAGIPHPPPERNHP